MVLRGSHQAGDHQLPHVQTGARRALLREDIRTHPGLGCLCGKYKRMKHRGVVCDKCGVEVTKFQGATGADGPHRAGLARCSTSGSSRGLPSRIGHLLDISLRDLERILYFESYVVVDPGDTDLKEKELLSEERYRQLRLELGDVFVARMGAGAIKELLQRVDVDMLSEELRMIMKTETSQIKRQKAAKRLKVCDAFRRSGHHPDWMILDVIPVIHRSCVPSSRWTAAARDLRPERPLPARHQPQQPVEETAGAAGARGHRPQREAHAAGGGERPVRQRPARTRAQGVQQPSPQVALRHAQGQAGPLPAEPAGQARGLLRPLGGRRGCRSQAPPGRPSPRRWPSSSSSRSSTTGSKKGLASTVEAAKELVESGVTEVWDALGRSSATMRCS